MSGSAESKLDLEKMNRKIWLVKVPSSIARIWRPLCEQSMNPGTGMDVEEEAPLLGKVNVKVSAPATPGSKPSRELSLVVPNAGAPGPASSTQQQPELQQQHQQQVRGPKAFRLSQLPINQAGTFSAISYKRPADDSGEGPSQLKAEGVVELSLNATPMAAQDAQGHVTVDDEYCNMSKQRNIQAATRTRSVRSYEDSRENHLALLANKRATDAATKRKGEEQRRLREENKRVRVDTPVLERELFRLFEMQPEWNFQQLQLETKQPTMHLKNVLEQIAVLQKRGRGLDVYVLKDEYAVGDEQGGDEEQEQKPQL